MLKSSIFFDTLLQMAGVTVLNIDDSPLLLTGLKLNNCFDDLNGIMGKITQHYKG